MTEKEEKEREQEIEKEPKIDWSTLEEYWSKRYEED